MNYNKNNLAVLMDLINASLFHYFIDWERSITRFPVSLQRG